MSDVRWNEVREWFDPMENGSVPDLVIADTTLADWEALLELVRTDGWRAEYECDGRRAEVPASAEDFFAADREGLQRSLWVWPDPDIEMIFRPWTVGEIVGDVDLFELQGQERLDTFCAIVRRLGQAMSKRVAMYAEGDHERHPPLLAYEVEQDRVVFLAGPWQR